ncbi:MAG: hypothetical protein FJX52_10260 [Alphaproteobacteria bacterium]|nr:hypothetical protein [Alphaproteobacteria bacterium]
MKADQGRFGAAVTRYNFLTRHADGLELRVVAHNRNCDRDLPENSPAEIACRMQKAELKDELAAYEASRAAHKAQLERDLDHAIANVQRRQDGTRALLAKVPNANASWTRDMEEWIALGRDARRHAQDAALFTAFDMVFEHLKSSVNTKKSIEERELTAVRAWVDKYGAEPLSDQALREVKERLKTARNWGDVLTLVDYIYRQHARFYEFVANLSGEMREQKIVLWQSATRALLEAIVNATGRHPLATSTVRATNLWVDVIYGWSAGIAMKNRIGEIARLQEASYAEVERLSCAYIDGLDSLTALRNARASLSNQSC